MLTNLGSFFLTPRLVNSCRKMVNLTAIAAKNEEAEKTLAEVKKEVNYSGHTHGSSSLIS